MEGGQRADGLPEIIVNAKNYVAEIPAIPWSDNGKSNHRNITGTATYTQKCCTQHIWVHARRDFVNAQRGDKKLGRWSEAWVRRIGKLYWLNKRRLRYFDSDVELSAQDALYEKADKRLADELNEFFALAKRQLEAVGCDSPKHEGLSRLVKFERGLRVFAGRPWVSMDNNLIERWLRPMVTVRKMSYGSKTEAAAALLGCMESVFATLRMNGIDERKWLKGYLLACAEAGGAPSDLKPWLPWSNWSMPP